MVKYCQAHGPVPGPNLYLPWLGSFPGQNWARSRHNNQTDQPPNPPITNFLKALVAFQSKFRIGIG